MKLKAPASVLGLYIPVSLRRAVGRTLSIMCRMVKLVKPLVPVMVAAVILGVVGFLCAIFLTVGAALVLTGMAGFEPALGVSAGIAWSPPAAFCAVPCITASRCATTILRSKSWRSSAIACSASCARSPRRSSRSKQKATWLSLVTSDVELLEVFYAHTLSPVLIAVLVLRCHDCLHRQRLLAACHRRVRRIHLGRAVALWAASRAAGMAAGLRDALGDMNSFVLDSCAAFAKRCNSARSMREPSSLMLGWIRFRRWSIA